MPAPINSMPDPILPDSESAANVRRLMQALTPEYLQPTPLTSQELSTPNPVSGKLPQLDPYSPIEQAAYGAVDLAGLAGPGAGIKAVGAAAKTLPAIFAGIGAKTADKAALYKAVNMANERLPMRQITQETGWSFWPDRKWMYEIPDTYTKDLSGKILSDPKTISAQAPMRYLFHHPELYEAYPELKSISGIAKKFPEEGGVRGYYIYESAKPPFKPGVDELMYSGSKDERTSTALHELQHAVTNIEGGAPGTTPDTMLPYAREAVLAAAPKSQHKLRLMREGAHEAYRAHVDEVRARTVQDRYENIWKSPTQVPPNEWRDVAARSARLAPIQMDVPANQQIFAPEWLAKQPSHVQNILRSLMRGESRQSPTDWRIIEPKPR